MSESFGDQNCPQQKLLRSRRNLFLSLTHLVVELCVEQQFKKLQVNSFKGQRSDSTLTPAFEDFPISWAPFLARLMDFPEGICLVIERSVMSNARIDLCRHHQCQSKVEGNPIMKLFADRPRSSWNLESLT